MVDRHMPYEQIAEIFIRSNNYLYNDGAQCALIRAVAIALDSEQITAEEFIKLNTSDYYFDSFIYRIIISHFEREDDGNVLYRPAINFLLDTQFLSHRTLKNYTSTTIAQLISIVKDVNSLYNLLMIRKFNEFDLIKMFANHFINSHFIESLSTENFRKFIKLCGNKLEYYDFIYSNIFNRNNSLKFKLDFVILVCNNKIEFLNDSKIKRLIIDQQIGLKDKFNLETTSYLLNFSQDYVSNVEFCLNNFDIEPANTFTVYQILNKIYKNKYISQATVNAKKALKQVFIFNQESWRARYEINEDLSGLTLSTLIGEFLVTQSKQEAFEYFSELALQSDFFQISFIKFLNEIYSKDCLKMLVHSLMRQRHIMQENYYETLFGIFGEYDCTDFIENIIDFAVIANKEPRLLTCIFLAKEYNNIIFEKAIDLLKCKTNNQRMVGVLILLNINNSKSNRALLDSVDNEKNDDARDIVVEALQKQIFPDHLNILFIKELISKAADRGKLSKWNEKNIDETSLPPLYWNDGSILSIEEVRFLFYRILRSKGLNSDIEARMTIKFLDKNRSEAFAKFILKSFNDTNQDIKLKHYLTLSAMLGGDESVIAFNALFKKAIVDKRARLAEIALESMAVIGNNKALRALEVVSRKMTSKKPKLSQLANEALEAAADELGITKDQLEDRIVPDFDFEGTYKTFMVGDDEYRAFVANDFTIQYMDEDNKIKKSLPKEIDKDSKVFFTEMSKELKDVVKNQVGRLEKYLTIGRVWSMEEWFASYINHPIMSVFSQKLLWYAKGNDGMIKETFMVQEDTSLTNIEDEEIELSENDQIGLLHPIFVDKSFLDAWGERLYNQNFKTLLSQLDRRVFFPNESELESNICKTFDGKWVPKKSDFVKTFMEKRGWIKEPTDGGFLIFYKIFHSFNLKVEPYIDGVAAWYQENTEDAIIHEINFYTYKPNDKFLIKDIPPIIYSEVMKDFQDMLDAQ
jgi:hypothetical protein